MLGARFKFTGRQVPVAVNLIGCCVQVGGFLTVTTGAAADLDRSNTRAEYNARHVKLN